MKFCLATRRPGDFYAGDLGAFIFASGGADALYGGAGKDILVGGTGADLLKSAGDSDILPGWRGGERRLRYLAECSGSSGAVWRATGFMKRSLPDNPRLTSGLAWSRRDHLRTFFYDGSRALTGGSVDKRRTEQAVGLAIGLEAVGVRGHQLNGCHTSLGSAPVRT